MDTDKMNQNNSTSKVSKKKIIIVLVVALCVVACASSSIVAFVKRHNQELSLQLKDTNGDINELCYLTEDDISDITEDYRAIKKIVETKGQNTSGIKGQYSDCDCNYVKTKIGMLSGIYICNAYLGDGNEVTYTIDSQLKSGNLKIIITDKSNNVLYDIPVGSSQTVSFVAKNSEVYYVKFVAESADLDITVERNR
jgi:hypothetical protein